MPAPEPSFEEYIEAQGLIFRAEAGYTGVAVAPAAVYTGVTTGPEEVIVLGRAYTSSESVLTIELFEATYSGGTPARLFNRRLSNASAAPATVMQGVTPGALGNVITGITLRATTSTSTASLQISRDDGRIYLKANTSYVVRYRNEGSQAATIGNAFDFRKVLKGEAWDKILTSM